MERWMGRLALVTGAANGIGAATAKKLLQNGMHVVGCDKDEAQLATFKSELLSEENKCIGENFHPIRCDLKKDEDIMEMFSKIKTDHGGVDACINCAGVGYKCPVLEGETWMFKDLLDINVLAYILTTRESIKQMRERNVDDGHVVFISSMAGHRIRNRTPAHCDFTVYNATKHALVALVQGIHHELRTQKSHIRISMISPGIVQTGFTHKMYPEDGASVDALYDSMKCLQADDVADEVVHMISRPPHVELMDTWIFATEQD